MKSFDTFRHVHDLTEDPRSLTFVVSVFEDPVDEEADRYLVFAVAVTSPGDMFSRKRGRELSRQVDQTVATRYDDSKSILANIHEALGNLLSNDPNLKHSRFGLAYDRLNKVSPEWDGIS